MFLSHDLQELIDEIKAAIEALRSSLTSENADEIRAKVEETQKAIMKIGTELSKKGGAGGDSAGDAAQEPEVKEAEYEEPKNNDKK